MPVISRRSVLAAAGAGLLPIVGKAAAGSLLQTQGNRLVYDGRQVRLRGVAVGDPALARADRPVSDYKTIADVWRANCVRLSIHPTAWKNEQAGTLRLLERDVAAALARRMWVIIDWHTIGWPDAYYMRPDPSWGSPDDLYDSSWSLARSFWQAIAERYGKEGRIAFELWNEPVEDPDAWNIPPGANWPELKARYEELVALIRVQASNLVLLGGDRWTYDLRGVRQAPVTGSNIGYVWHCYVGTDDNDIARWARALDDLDRHFPIVVTEWGFCRTCDGAHFEGTPESFGNRFVRKFLNGRSLNWTAWCWHPEWTPAMLERDWRTANEFGRFVKAELAKGSQQRP